MPARATPPSDADLDRLIGRLYRHALAIGHDPARAEDAVQDALLGVCRAGGPWDEAYLRRAVRHRALDSITSDRRRARRERAWHLLAPAGERGAPRGAEGDEALSAALRSLRPIEREAIYLAVVEGMGTRQIAAAMGRPRGSVLSLIHRARRRLRERIADPIGSHGHE